MAFNDENKSWGNGYSHNGSGIGGEYGVPKNGKSPAADPDEIDLKQLFFTLWNHRWIIVSSVLFCSILAGVIAYSMTPIFRSEGSMLITESSGQSALAGSDLGSLLSSTYGVGMGSTIANELQVLRSRKLSYELADTLIEHRLMTNGRQFPVLWRSYPEDSMITSRDTVAMRLRNNLEFNQVDREADLIRISYESPSPLEASFVVNQSMSIYSEISTRQNRMSANSAVAFLKKEREHIEERLVNVEERLREFMNEHRLVQVDAQTEELIKQMATLESARQEARVKLVAVNSAIGQYNERMNGIMPGLAQQYADAIGPNMARLQYQLAEHEIEKMRLLANNPKLEDSPNPPHKLVELNQKIDLYKERIKELTQKLMEQSDQYLGFLGGTGGNIAENITELNQKLIELQVEEKQYQAQVDVLTEQLAEQERFFTNLPDNMIELARLQRDATISEELYLTVSKQYAEMALWEQTQFGLGRTIDTGFIPEEPIAPNKPLFVLVGFILGGIAGVGYVLVRTGFNTTIDGVDKLKKLHHSLLAVIPVLDDKRFRTTVPKGETMMVHGKEVTAKLVTLVDSISPASEAFRRLQNNIVYAHPGKRLKTIMITSSTQGEGKSTTCANLAVSLSEMGKEVLIMDLDLRRPNMHNLLGLRQSPGIFDVLFDNMPFQEAVQPTVIQGVDLLSAGKRPPNPPAVLQSEALKRVIDSVKEHYDFVLIDTAPFGIITDAASLAESVDGAVVVARFNVADEEQLNHTLTSLQTIHAHVLGVVLTAFDYSKSNDGYGSRYYRQTYEDYRSYER